MQRVLIVDDDPALRRLIRRVVERVPGFEVAGEADEGRRALTLALEDPPDIVLTDVTMPEMDGVELTRRLLDVHPDVRVVALTGAEPEGAVSDMIRNGAIGYLVKTASLEEMVQALTAVGRGLAVLSPEATLVVLRDLVQHYRAEQDRARALEALDTMKRDFMNVISHELKTPVTIIKGGVQMLRRRGDQLDPEQQRTFLDSIERQTRRLQRMIDQVLMVSQIEKGLSREADEKVDLYEIINTVIADLPEEARNRIDIEASADQAMGRRDAMEQIMRWVVENALAFSEDPIRIRTRMRSNEVLVQVEDRGVGMDAELVRRVLTEPFTQKDASSTRVRDGLGMSLYAGRKVMENLGGGLEIDSAPGRGTTVSLRLAAGPEHLPATTSHRQERRRRE